MVFSKEFLAVLIALLVFSMITPVAAGTTWVVDDDGGSDYTTIQAAINSASEYDIIIVRDGTYNENVNVDVSNLTIRSENGSASATVQAADSGDHVLDVTEDYVNISGITVKGATTAGKEGVRLNNANYCNVSDINATENSDGIYLLSSSNNTLQNNTANSNNRYGIYVRSSSNNTIQNNTANLNDQYGIYLSTLSNNNTLVDNSALGNDRGIQLHSSSYNTLLNNTAKDNNYQGIFLYTSSNNLLQENNANSNNWYGIFLQSSNYNTLRNNTARSNNQYGIYLINSCTGNTITENKANSNDDHGIYLYNGCTGNNLTDNTVKGNDYGIYLFNGCTGNKITGNAMEDNKNQGIYLGSSSNNEIYNNYLNSTSNSYDDGTNIWNTTKTAGTNIIGGPYIGGNYWSDYTGVDSGEDGLGDTPYSITGGSNQDKLPLVKDFFISCDRSGNEKNLFMPGEGIYVKAEGLLPNSKYIVWMQDNPVISGDPLNSSEDPSGVQEIVISDVNGSISPTLVWRIPSSEPVTHDEYDIVLDNQIGSDVGVYKAASDRIDSATAAGVTAPVPELTSIAMVLMGIMVILGYVFKVKM